MSEPKYIKFVDVGRSKSGKTRIWEVRTREDDTFLGEIRWHAPWRCYSFFVSSRHGEFDFVFEKRCLRDLADFCENETYHQKNDHPHAVVPSC